jgi:hypothetical protein
MWDHKILYADRTLKAEQILMAPLLWESKNMNMAGSSKSKSAFYFMENSWTIALKSNEV